MPSSAHDSVRWRFSKRTYSVTLCALLPWLAFNTQALADAGEQSQQLKRLLARHCLECHQGDQAEAGLDLSHRAGAITGGASGPALGPDSKDSALLIERVRSGEMPPETPLSESDKRELLELLPQLELWPETPIDPWTQSSESRAGYDWWSLAPLVAPPLPEQQSADFTGRHPIDQFVQQELAKQGLSPAPLATERDQVRRLFADLIGLPPTFEQVRDFEANPSDEAWNQLVDELLASDAYAQRWTQHWLDVARFGESNGFEYNEPREGAWHYRDWVIRSLRDDLPYNEFARMQIAGDLIQPNSIDGLAATGFLVAGIHNTVIGQSEAMRRNVRHAELEEIASTTSQAFLGLTIHCARCHDHKFDPIRTDEYYRFISALDGITHGTRNVAPTIDAQESLQRRDVIWRQILRDARARNQSLSHSANSLTLREPLTDCNEAGVKYQVNVTVAPTVWSNPAQQTLPTDGVCIELLRANGNQLTSYEILPGVWPQTPEGPAFETYAFTYTGDGNGPLQLRLSSLLHQDRFGGAIDRVQIQTEAGETIFIDTFDDFTPQQPAGTQADTGFKVHWGMKSQKWIYEGLNSIHALELTPGEFAVQIYGGMIDQPFTPQSPQQESWFHELQQLEQQALTVSVYTIVPRDPGPMHVARRGDPMQPLDAVAPGGLAAIQTLPHDFQLTVDATDADRRMQLAQWMTHPDNGPFHRTIVNRLWHLHFGRGLVATPSDLGWAGGQPSHPELLDWMACWFRDHDYSLKQLHRLIVTSHTYRQSARSIHPRDSQANAIDADNRWLWRQNPRRLDAESLRDAMLAVSNRLDPSLFGPSYRDVQVEVIGAAHYYRPLDSASPELNRRSLYRWRVRADRTPLLEAFDCPEPSTPTPARAITTTPTQALSLWNDPFVLRASDWLAERIEHDAGSEQQVQAIFAWRLTLARDPSVQELRLSETLVREQGLPALCRVLFNSTEFVVFE